MIYRNYDLVPVTGPLEDSELLKSGRRLSQLLGERERVMAREKRFWSKDDRDNVEPAYVARIERIGAAFTRRLDRLTREEMALRAELDSGIGTRDEIVRYEPKRLEGSDTWEIWTYINETDRVIAKTPWEPPGNGDPIVSIG